MTLRLSQNPLPSTALELVDALLQRAFESGASDIHFESDAEAFRVRFRVDGHLQIAAHPPLALRDAVVSRIKVLARLDIAEKRLPQDGRMLLQLQGQPVDLRVSSLPTVHGEKIVLRLLNFSQERPSLGALGFDPADQALVVQAIARPHGLVLITGPTGSGKTLSLYSCLELLNRVEVNISTVEDPCEIYLSGANQISILERCGLTFATALRALLRQDPDVLMVGEIRDAETAEIAIQAAHTGHMVLSTLHTNDAPSTLARLQHMGIAAFQVASSINLVVAQRLVRRLCVHCKLAESETHSRNWLENLPPADIASLTPFFLSHNPAAQPAHNVATTPTIYQPVGCKFCQKGYKGRIGIYQIMPVTASIQDLILQRSDAHAIAALAKQEGMLTLRQAGWRKVLQGVTSTQEIVSQTHHA